jgi:hypothetical protein
VQVVSNVQDVIVPDVQDVPNVQYSIAVPVYKPYQETTAINCSLNKTSTEVPNVQDVPDVPDVPRSTAHNIFNHQTNSWQPSLRQEFAATLAIYDEEFAGATLATYDEEFASDTLATYDKEFAAAATLATYDEEFAAAATLATYNEEFATATLTTYDKEFAAATLATYDEELAAATTPEMGSPRGHS